MPVYTFDRSAPDGAALSAEVAAAGVPGLLSVRYTAGQILLDFAALLTAPQQTALAGVVAAHDNSPAAQAVRVLATQRSEAVSLLSDPAGQQKLVRAALLGLNDRDNAICAWAMALVANIAAATSLADLKSRVALQDTLPQVSAAQARTAVQGKINNGAADS